MTRLVLGVVALLAVLVLGCGEEGSRDGGAAETTPAPRPAPVPEATPAPAPGAEDHARAAPGAGDHPRAAPDAGDDHGRRHRRLLHALRRLRDAVATVGDYVWSEPTVRSDAVALAPVDHLQDPGFSEWVVFAVQPGTATIAARGTPACADQERCPDAPLSFKVQITRALSREGS